MMEELSKRSKEQIEIYRQLHTQAMENEQVLEELKNCDDDQVIFKSVGPIMMKQDKAEAVLTVEKRLEYIKSQQKIAKSEIDKINAEIKFLIEKENTISTTKGNGNSTSDKNI